MRWESVYFIFRKLQSNTRMAEKKKSCCEWLVSVDPPGPRVNFVGAAKEVPLADLKAPAPAFIKTRGNDDPNEDDSYYSSLVRQVSSLWNVASSALSPAEEEEYNEKKRRDIKSLDASGLQAQLEASEDFARAQSEIKSKEGNVDSAEALASAQRTSIKIANGSLAFDGDLFAKLVGNSLDSKTKLVNASQFIASANLVPLLIGGLGRAFEFAGTDLAKKLTTAQQRMEETAEAMGMDIKEVTLQDMVELDIERGVTHAGKKAAHAARTILRLLWFMDFVAALLEKSGKQQSSPMSKIVGDAYEETLGPKHNFMLRKIARSGMRLLPGKEVFRKRLNTQDMTLDEESKKLIAWAKEPKRVSDTMWEYMRSKNLEELP